ncbi:MAG: hypothetical protein KKE37_03385 [Verrucomicrobia bacterium]|nr:hypothetical protein [Verrucomicrobiota bacterium]MBU4248466.1 hypothetical protein [Verrucomicrobiota bacterium]MBU4292393.1 hypothetical protein [Verrucomicrobiota bacterium]MBU4428381.1 hypothetical protein [Verrucomicrobiota bacterium]MCG2679426.1 hypothetical protein [Kiritimatiellia bacterium]
MSEGLLLRADGCYPTGGVDLAKRVLAACKKLNQNAVHFGASEEAVQYLVEQAHKASIKVFLYTFGQEFRKLMAQNRQWNQRYADGKISGILCPNNEDFLKASTSAMRIYFKKIAVDGFFYDGPSMPPQCCYCAFCRKKFKEQYGMEIPKEQDEDSMAWKQFKEFRYLSVARLAETLNLAIKEANPKALFYTNTTGGIHRLWWLSARDPALMGPVQDIEGSESFMYYHTREQGNNRPHWSVSACAKINRAAVDERKPAVVFTTNIPRPGGDLTLPDVLMENLIFQAVSQGNGIWIEGATMNVKSSPETARVIRRSYDFIAAHEDCYLEASSCAPVALLYSRQCGDHYAIDPAEESDWTTAEEKGGSEGQKLYVSAFHGVGELLLRSQVPWDIVLDKDLTAEKLARYKVLVLENSPCLSRTQCEAIRKYVAAGGALLAAYETSLYDEWGRKQNDFQLADVFGVRIDKDARFRKRRVDWSTGEIAKEQEMTIEEYGRIQERLGWLIHFNSRHQVFKGVRDRGQAGITYFSPYSLVGLKTARGASALGEWTDEPNRGPAVVANAYGKGRCLYFSGSTGAMFYIRQHLELQRLMKNSLHWLSRRQLPILVESPSDTVEVSLMRIAGGRFIIHLVNYSFNGDRPVNQVYPVRDLKITLKDRNLREMTKARLLVGHKNVAVRQGTITIPLLEVYEGIVLG